MARSLKLVCLSDHTHTCALIYCIHMDTAALSLDGLVQDQLCNFNPNYANLLWGGNRFLDLLLLVRGDQVVISLMFTHVQSSNTHTLGEQIPDGCIYLMSNGGCYFC